MEYIDSLPKPKVRTDPPKGKLLLAPVPPTVSEWLSPNDPAWSWEDSGRSGGVYVLTEDELALNRPNAKPDGLEESPGFFRPKVGGRSKAPPLDGLKAGIQANSLALESNHLTLIGQPYPRIAPISSPLYDYSYGNALVNWSAEVLGIELMPWQQFLIREGCARRNGRFRYRTLLTVVARQNGKTLLAAIRILGGLCLFGERFHLGCAQNLGIALESWQLAWEIAEGSRLPVGKIRNQHGRQSFHLGSGRYRVVAATIGSSRGLSGVDLVLMDEIRQMKNWDAYGAIDKTRRARPDSQLWAITTEGDLESEVLNRLQDRARDAIQLGKESPLGYWEWSAEPDAHPGKPETWAQANPSLGHTIDLSVIEAEYETDPPSVFEVEVLCRKVSRIEAWVNPRDWDDCSSDTPFPADMPFVLAVESGPELRHVSLVAGALQDGFHCLELVDSFSGPEALTAAENRLDSLLSRWQPFACVTLAKSPVEASTSRIAASHGIEHVAVRPAEWARACRAFYAAANQRTLRHPGGSGISQALAATKRGPDGLVSSVHRLNPEADIDAALAAVLAMWIPTQQPEPDPVPTWTVY